jgi:ribose-phosphate pyrophosphokinase
MESKQVKLLLGDRYGSPNSIVERTYMAGSHHNHDCGMYGDIKIFAGTASEDLADEIACYLEAPLSDHTLTHFANDNLWIQLNESVRGQDVYIIQTTSQPVHQNLMELLIMLQTLRLDSAGRVTAVIPYLCYTRSDKKDKPRVPITARLVADMVEIAGADRYMTLDMHAGQIQGFFSIPGDVLSAFHILATEIESMLPQMHDPVVVATDLGFAKKGRNFASRIHAPIAFVEKRRAKEDDETEALTLIGHVEDHDVIIVDDEVDTAGSITKAVEVVKAYGARDVYMTFVHPVFSADAVNKLSAAPITKIITTNTVPIPAEKLKLLDGKLKICSVAPLLAEVILHAHEGRSVGEMLQKKYAGAT